jgi:hypothetical protein
VTAPQIIQEIETAGGILALKGDRIAYDMPKSARGLVDVLRLHREEVLQVLRERHDAAKHQVSRWMAARCAAPKNPARVWASEESLYRDYGEWCEQSGQTIIPREQFAATLTETFGREQDGWQGLCLAVDWAASNGLGCRSLATERIQ